ncbi:MAG: peptidoglycan DD-metalloendopeptidase family protein [Tissierellia bacterium]|nr:peptidoglycan DD-metalloendopeptidase family protein [Tissierellia bacterium]
MDDPSNLEIHGSILPKENIKILETIKKTFTNKDNHKRLLITIFIAVIGILSFAAYKTNEINTRAFIVYFGDEEIGIVREQEEALNILANIKRELSTTYDMDIVLQKGLKFEDTHAKDELLATSNELKNNIKSKMSFLVSGYVLLVDDEEIGTVKTKKEADEILESLKEPYLGEDSENRKIQEIKFVEDVQIEKREIPLNQIKDSKELLQYIQTGTEEVKTHIVEVGESLWTIAKIYDMDVEDLIEANPEINPEKLQIGDEVKLLVPKSLITVATVEEVKYTEKINYEVEIEENKNMYKTEKKVKVKGSPGESEIVAKVTKHNGKTVAKKIIEEVVIEEPVTEIVVKGTKEVPKTIATGAFLMPTRGRISSRYGMRNGRMHRGLDIAARTGTPIKAADGGKVVFTGRKGAYGNLVEIDHGNGYVTRYAHCSSINVKTGDRVYKGQVIAKVGNTGRSTGSHLHFEVLKNGRNQNPAGYVR